MTELLVLPSRPPVLVGLDRLHHIRLDLLDARVHEHGAVVEGAVLDEQADLLGGTRDGGRSDNRSKVRCREGRG